MCVSWGPAGSSPGRERGSAKYNYKTEPGSLASHLLPDGKNLVQRRQPQVPRLYAHLKWCLHRGAHKHPQCPGFLQGSGSGCGLSSLGMNAWTLPNKESTLSGSPFPFFWGKNEISLSLLLQGCLCVHAAGSLATVHRHLPVPPAQPLPGHPAALGHGPLHLTSIARDDERGKRSCLK